MTLAPPREEDIVVNPEPMCYKLIYPKTKMNKFNPELSFEREIPEKDNANSKRSQTLNIGHRAKQEDPLHINACAWLSVAKGGVSLRRMNCAGGHHVKTTRRFY